MTARLRTLLVLLLLLSSPCLAEQAQTVPLRFCADPDNLPFSSEVSTTPGIYIEIGRQIAATIGRPFEPVWTPTNFGKHQVRTRLLTRRCDGFLGLPEDAGFMGPRVIFSKPLLSLGYALATPKTAPASDLDNLSGHRVAVQFASPPQTLLAERSDIQTVTVLSPEEGMHDLVEGKVDAAFVWGPSAGWINHNGLHDSYHVVPIAGPHMRWQAAVGFSSDQADLRDSVDRALAELGRAIETLKVKYGFPAVPMVKPLSESNAATAGHKLFNQNCAHCHGPDAVEGVRRQNLRLLHHRYGDRMDEIFTTTVTHGRPTKGMPNWSGVLTDPEFQDILAFLHSVQEP